MAQWTIRRLLSQRKKIEGRTQFIPYCVAKYRNIYKHNDVLVIIWKEVGAPRRKRGPAFPLCQDFDNIASLGTDQVVLEISLNNSFIEI